MIVILIALWCLQQIKPPGTLQAGLKFIPWAEFTKARNVQYSTSQSVDNKRHKHKSSNANQITTNHLAMTSGSNNNRL